MSFLGFCQWLESTSGSVALHESVYVYPIVESVHVWALALFLGLAIALDLRLLGVVMRDVPVAGHAAAAAVDDCRLHRHDRQRTAALLCDPGEDLSEHFFPRQDGDAGSGRHQRLGVSRKRLAPRDGLGSRSRAARKRADGGNRIAPALGRHRVRGPDDRLQLVRLQQAAAGPRVCAGRLHTAGRDEVDDVAPGVLSVVREHGDRQLHPRFTLAVSGDQSFHILGLAFIGGAILIVDLRLLGLGLRQQPVARIARDAYPWMTASLFVMLVTGTLLFLSEAMKCYNSFAFTVKMTSLVLAIVFAYTIRRRVTAADEAAVGRSGARWSD